MLNAFSPQNGDITNTTAMRSLLQFSKRFPDYAAKGALLSSGNATPEREEKWEPPHPWHLNTPQHKVSYNLECLAQAQTCCSGCVNCFIGGHLVLQLTFYQIRPSPKHVRERRSPLTTQFLSRNFAKVTERTNGGDGLRSARRRELGEREIAYLTAHSAEAQDRVDRTRRTVPATCPL